MPAQYSVWIERQMKYGTAITTVTGCGAVPIVKLRTCDPAFGARNGQPPSCVTMSPNREVI